HPPGYEPERVDDRSRRAERRARLRSGSSRLFDVARTNCHRGINRRDAKLSARNRSLSGTRLLSRAPNYCTAAGEQIFQLLIGEDGIVSFDRSCLALPVAGCGDAPVQPSAAETLAGMMFASFPCLASWAPSTQILGCPRNRVNFKRVIPSTRPVQSIAN